MVVFETVPPDCVKLVVVEYPEPELLEIWNPPGAVKVMFVVKSLPETVNVWYAELVFTSTSPKSGNEVFETVIDGDEEQFGATKLCVPFELFVLPASFIALT